MKEYQELTPLSRIFAPIRIQGSHIFKWADEKTGRQPFTKFSGFVGDTETNIIT